MSGYEFSLLPKSGITGTFVAMSIFQPAALPALTAAKGHPYFIYHSPQDFIPIAQPEAARDALRKAGAIVEFQTYEGALPGSYALSGVIEFVTGVSFLEFARRWDELKVWQRGIFGTFIVVIALFLIIAVGSLIVSRL
jgi:hypothetical protein